MDYKAKETARETERETNKENNKKQYLTVIYLSHIYRLIIKDLRKINI